MVGSRAKGVAKVDLMVLQGTVLVFFFCFFSQNVAHFLKYYVVQLKIVFYQGPVRCASRSV